MFSPMRWHFSRCASNSCFLWRPLNEHLKYISTTLQIQKRLKVSEKVNNSSRHFCRSNSWARFLLKCLMARIIPWFETWVWSWSRCIMIAIAVGVLLHSPPGRLCLHILFWRLIKDCGIQRSRRYRGDWTFGNKSPRGSPRGAFRLFLNVTVAFMAKLLASETVGLRFVAFDSSDPMYIGSANQIATTSRRSVNCMISFYSKMHQIVSTKKSKHSLASLTPSLDFRLTGPCLLGLRFPLPPAHHYFRSKFQILFHVLDHECSRKLSKVRFGIPKASSVR